MIQELLERRYFDMTGSFNFEEARDLLARRTCRLLRALDDVKAWRGKPGWENKPEWHDAIAAWFGFPSAWAYRRTVEGLMSMGYVGDDDHLHLTVEGPTFSDQLGEHSMAQQTGRGRPGDAVDFLASVLLR